MFETSEVVSIPLGPIHTKYLLRLKASGPPVSGRWVYGSLGLVVVRLSWLGYLVIKNDVLKVNVIT